MCSCFHELLNIFAAASSFRAAQNVQRRSSEPISQKLFLDVVDLFLPIPHVQNTVDQK